MMGEVQLVAVAGVIGVGKSTLARGLAEALGAALVQEKYGENPFLAMMLSGRREAALACELDFLLGRARQLSAGSLGAGLHVADYVFDKNRLFARRNLAGEEMVVFERVEGQVRELIVRPGMVVYLVDRPERCWERVQRRGRAYEMGLSVGFLEGLAQAYEDMMARWEGCPVLRVDAGELDVREAMVVEGLAGSVRAALGSEGPIEVKRRPKASRP